LLLESQPGPVSSSILVRELLGLRGGPGTPWEALLEPILGGDPRFERAPGGGWCLGEPRPDHPPPPSTWSWSVWAVESGFRSAAVVRLEGGRTVAEAEAAGSPPAGRGPGRHLSAAAAEACDDGAPPACARAEPPQYRRGTDEGDRSRPPWRGHRAGAAARPLSRPALRSLLRTARATAWVSAEPVGLFLPFARRLVAAAGPVEGAPSLSLRQLAAAAGGAEPLPRGPGGLAVLAARLGAGPVALERPLDRARAAAECLLRILEIPPLARARALEELELLARARPAPVELSGRAFGAADLAAIPDRPGIYRFLDAADRLLYVGKAKSLRARVGSYFAARRRPDLRTAPWLGRVHRFELEESGSELEALLREAEGIALARPLHNVQRKVHPRRRGGPGHLVLILPAPRGRGARACLLRDGELVARVALGPGRRGEARLARLLERFYFAPAPQAQAARGAARGAPAASLRTREGTERARALITSWLGRQEGPVPAFDPTDAADARGALAIALDYAASLARGDAGVIHR
jgi:hypothetical protein